MQPTLDRDRIVAEAVALVDEVGLEHLSMRRLARRLDSAPMSLYRHVAGKDELVHAVIEALLGQLSPVDPEQPWDEVVATTFTRIRCLLRDHPRAVPYLTDGAFVNPTALWLSETVLAALRRAGLDETGAAHAFSALWTFTVGSALVEHTVFTPRAERAPAVASPDPQGPVLDAPAVGGYPRLAEAAPHWDAAGPAIAFEEGLALLLDAIRARGAQI